MGRSTRITILFVLWFIIVPLQILPTIGGGQHNAQSQEEKPSIGKMVRDTISLWKQSNQRSWDRIKTVIKEMQFQFSPPNIDFKNKHESDPEGGVDGHNVGEKIKEAAEKSFETSKHTVEGSAKSAAKVVGEAMNKGTEKVKESITDKDGSHAEL